MQPEQIGWTERIGYAVGDLGFCLYWNTFSVFLLIFYTDTFGISAAAAGTMLLVTRTWDNFVDPIMGMAADRTRSRFGRFRPWLLWMCLPFGISGVLTFTAPNLSPGGKLIYAYVTVTLLMLFYTMLNVPYAALLGVITRHGEERTRLSSYRFVGAFSGNLVVQGTFLYLVKTLGRGNDRVGYPLTLVVYGCVAMALFLFTFGSTRERVQPVERHKSSVKQDLWDLARNKPWLVLAAVNIMFQIWVGIKLAAQVYYFKYVIGDVGGAAAWQWLPSSLVKYVATWDGMVAAWMLAGTAFSLLGAVSAPAVMKLLGGKRSAYIYLSLLNAVFCAPLFFAGPHDLPLIFGSQILGSFVSGPLNPLTWAMFADTADYGEWRFGRRSTGLVFSAGSFAQKMGAVLGSAVAGWLLFFYGYKPNVMQTPTAVFGIRMMVGLLPAAASVLTAVFALFYSLNAKLEGTIAADLKERRAAASAE
ncbi:MAG: MFS transporter [Bryobacteraceae bacterium]|jgi:GPH family glycoside/pentoside/hexuronide:cation symporter